MQAPERPVVICSRGQLTYGDCLARSETAASGLFKRGIERFGCVFQSSMDTVIAVCAASATGSEACVYPRDPGAGGQARLASRFDHHTILTDSVTPIPGTSQLTLTELCAPPRRPIEPPTAFPVLILTTGTTGEQKGARHDWARLVKVVRHDKLRPGSRWLLAYNLNQFAGIQVLLHVLASAGTLVEPVSRAALEAVAAISEHRVTHVSATPTFWRLLAGHLDHGTAAELPLEQITLGGEAAPEGLIQRLRGLFPSARISHVYAGTEFGSAVSVRDGVSGLPLSVLQRDRRANVQFRIVSGELQIRSRVGMVGYHGSYGDADEWHATGDLVEVRNGRIQFVGRTTEIINVGGAKVHPLPVEELICSVEGVQLAAVYGRASAVTGQIVAVDVLPAPGRDRRQLERRIKDACQALPAPARPRRIRFVLELDVRGSKLVRHEAG